jgi:two-component system, chemotaxis family, CheB/CheR fusion protein
MVDHSNNETPLPPAARGEGGPFVVGIGASAGGVLALRQFFSRVVPDCGMAFVVILHMSPQHESNLPALLQSQTNLPVTQVNAAVKVEPNHIYVISPNNYLVIADGHIRLTEPQLLRGGHTSIDLFFRTLADAYGKNAIAVLLSGTGKDGTLGLRRIKEEGGFVIAEDPIEAEYGDMPRNAIDSGLVDLVLPVGEMVDKICSLRDGVQRLDEEEPLASETDEAALADVLRFLRVRTGHDFAHYKRATLMRRIARRLQVHELAHLSDYLNLLQRTPGEAEVLFRDLLISVTNFFRDHDSFDFLAGEVIPKLFDGKGPGDQVRVWSAGCATGEEAYSLAMLLSEYAAQLTQPPKLQVFATDIDERSILEGRECRYPASITLDVSPERLQRFFVKDEAGYEIKKELREIVLFAVHNMLRDPPFSRLDLISCRNLLIYLNRDMQRRVLGVFHFALRPDGFLFLGTSESAEMLPSLYSPIDKKRRIYSRRRVDSQHPFAADWLYPRWQAEDARDRHAGRKGPLNGRASPGSRRVSGAAQCAD